MPDARAYLLELGQRVYSPNNPPPSGGAPTYEGLMGALSGVVHRWKFEDASGDFLDSVGGLTLVRSGTVPTFGVAGGPVSGLAGSVTFGATTKGQTGGLGSIPVGAADRTIIAVYKAAPTANLQPVASYGTASTRQALAIAPGYISGAVATGMGYLCWAEDTSDTQAPYRDGVWHMTAIVVSASQNISGFHDGDFVSKFLAGSVNTVDDGTHFTCGTCQNAVGGQFLGTMDDLAVLSRAVQPYELQQLYNTLIGSWSLVPSMAATTLIEKDLGSTPLPGGSFDVVVPVALVAGSAVHVEQVAGVYTGKGTVTDEAEMDPVVAYGYAVSTTTLRVYWTALRGPVAGNVKFAYFQDRTLAAVTNPVGAVLAAGRIFASANFR